MPQPVIQMQHAGARGCAARCIFQASHANSSHRVLRRSRRAGPISCSAADKNSSTNSGSLSSTSSSSVGAAEGASASSSSGGAVQAPDKWEETLAVHHTLNSLYLRKVKVKPFEQLDHEQRRKDKEMKEICEAGRRLNVSEAVLKENMAQLVSLLPDLNPNLDQMKASDWAKVLRDVAKVALIVITLREQFPRANISTILRCKPKLLLGDAARIEEDALQVKAMLAGVEDVDAIVEAVPYLLDPQQLVQSLANLRRWFPNQDTLVMLQKNPKLLVNIEEADLEADPLYGLPTQDPTTLWPVIGPVGSPPGP